MEQNHSSLTWKFANRWTWSINELEINPRENTSHKWTYNSSVIQNFFISLHIVVCERLSVMQRQSAVHTVNLCPKSPESPFLEFQTREAPTPYKWKTSDLGWPKFRPESPLQMKNLEHFSDSRFHHPRIFPPSPPPPLRNEKLKNFFSESRFHHPRISPLPT